jgi:hypothetical protein
MNCDWLESFDARLGVYNEIQSLAKNNFHGSLEINFAQGVPQNFNLKLHRRAENQSNLNKKEV